MPRLIDHLHITVRDLDAARRFYGAVMSVIGVALYDIPDKRAFTAGELWVTDDGPLTGRIHFAFRASDAETVQRFHAAGLAAGGRDNGGPGERAYHPGYYAAFLLDPDGNNVEAVFHGRSG